MKNRKKIYSLKNKKAYYEKRSTDKNLTYAQRNYASNLVKGINHFEKQASHLNSSDPLALDYLLRRRVGVKELLRNKLNLKRRYSERKNDTDYREVYHQNKLENDDKIAFFNGHLIALNDRLSIKPTQSKKQYLSNKLDRLKRK